MKPRLWPTSRLFCLDFDVKKGEGESYKSWLPLNLSCRKFLRGLLSIVRVEIHDNRHFWRVHTHSRTNTHTHTPCNACIHLWTNKIVAFLWSHMRFSCVSKCYATPLSHISLHFQFHPLFTQLLCVKMRTTQLKSFATMWLLRREKKQREKKAKRFSIKGKRSLNMRFFRHGTNPACSSFSQINGLSEPLVKWVHYSSSLLMTILAFEHASSRYQQREYDPYCSGMTPINTEMAKVKTGG